MKTHGKFNAIIAVLFLGLSLTVGGIFDGGFASEGKTPVHRLVVLHTNDTHGHPVKFFLYPSKDAGGLPARATLVRQIRASNRNVLLLDAGDLNTGRPESNLFRARPDIEGYNTIGYDAMVLGNHEFDRPIPILKEQMALARFPFLSANVKTTEGEYLAKPYIIKGFEGFNAAIFGLTTKSTPYMANPAVTKGLVFEDEIEVAQKLVPELKKRADIVIALVHMGLYRSHEKGSKRLASQVPGIDLIVDGHTHTKLDAPVWIPSGPGRKTPIVQAWQWGLLLGRVDLKIQSKKVIGLEFEAIPINLKTVTKGPDGTRAYRLIGEKIEEDKTLVGMLAPYVEETNSRLSEVVGLAEGHFFRKGLRQRESALGNIIADAMLWHTKRLGVDFAIQNGGGIRADLPRGEITKALIHEILPFDNTVVVLTLKGSDVRTLVDHMCAVRSGSGAFPQISEGLRLTTNRSRGECGNVLIRGQPLDPDRTYKVATNSYLAMGGDGYKMFLRAVDKYDTALFQRDVFIEYIKHLGGRIRPKLHKRIIISRPHHSRPDTPEVESDLEQAVSSDYSFLKSLWPSFLWSSSHRFMR